MCRAIILCILFASFLCAQNSAPVTAFGDEPALPNTRYPAGTIGYNAKTGTFEVVNLTGTAWLKLGPLPLTTPVTITPLPIEITTQPPSLISGTPTHPIVVSPAPVTVVPPVATAAPSATPPPSDVFMVFGSYAPGGAPPVGGGFSYAKLVSTSQVVYSFSTYQTTLVKGKLQSSPTTGFFTRIKQIGPVQIGVYGQVGLATTTITTAAFAGGGNAFLQIGKTKWILGGGYEALKGTSTPQGTFRLILGRTD